MDLLGKRQAGRLTRGGPMSVAADSEVTLSRIELKSIHSIVNCCHYQQFRSKFLSSTRYLRSWQSGKRTGEVRFWLVRQLHTTSMDTFGGPRKGRPLWCHEEGSQHPQPQPWLSCGSGWEDPGSYQPPTSTSSALKSTHRLADIYRPQQSTSTDGQLRLSFK